MSTQRDLQEEITEVINCYLRDTKKPSLYAAFYGHVPCHDKMACAVAGLIDASIRELCKHVDNFSEPKDGWGTYDDREYRADSKDAA